MDECPAVTAEDAARDVERAHCVAVLELLALGWRAELLRIGKWHGEYYEGVTNGTTSCAESLEGVIEQLKKGKPITSGPQ